MGLLRQRSYLKIMLFLYYNWFTNINHTTDLFIRPIRWDVERSSLQDDVRRWKAMADKRAESVAQGARVK